MHRISHKHATGFHLKTAWTTWLEEVAGLAAAGGDGLAVARDVYAEAYRRFEEMTGPYRSVVAIDRAKLPEPGEVARWSGEEFVRALRHNPSSEYFNPHLRQLVHVGFKVAAEMGTRFTSLLEKHRDLIEPFVTENILTKHINPLFVGRAPAETAGRGGREPKSAAKAAR